MRRVPATCAAMLMAVTLSGATCDSVDTEAPAQVYRSFATSMNRGDMKVAWELLSHDTQAELTREAQAIARVRGLPAPADGRQLAFFDSFMLHREIRSTTIDARTADRATVVVTDDGGGQQTINTVREGKQWRVDLTAEIRQANQG